MGLGKTVITLTAIKELIYNRFEVQKVLIVAPKKVAQTTWSNEASKWDHLEGLRISKVIGTLNQRIKALNTPADIYVINRDNVQWIVEYYRNAWCFDMVVLDEASSFKNHRAKRFKALTRVRHSIDRIVELTGTPSPNGLQDLWAQIYLLDQGERLGKTITAFRERYFTEGSCGFIGGQKRVYKYNLKQGAELSIHNAIGDICVSMKAEDYIDLPDFIPVDVEVELDPKAKAMYDELERKMLLQVDDKEIDVTSAAALNIKLLQLCNGACYDNVDDKNVVEIHDSKIEALLELVEGLNGQHALVAYYFKHDLARIETALEKTGLRVRRLENPEDEAAWNAGEIDILLAHPASAAYGLNLQDGGHHVIWFGLNWALEQYQQFNKRLHRQGQEHKVICHRLICKGGLDEDVVAAIEHKGDVQAELLEALKARIDRVKSAAQGVKEEASA